jgi:hypothetical protein
MIGLLIVAFMAFLNSDLPAELGRAMAGGTGSADSGRSRAHALCHSAADRHTWGRRTWLLGHAYEPLGARLCLGRSRGRAPAPGLGLGRDPEPRNHREDGPGRWASE